jgi:hypothetical protein
MRPNTYVKALFVAGVVKLGLLSEEKLSLRRQILYKVPTQKYNFHARPALDGDVVF